MGNNTAARERTTQARPLRAARRQRRSTDHTRAPQRVPGARGRGAARGFSTLCVLFTVYCLLCTVYCVPCALYCVLYRVPRTGYCCVLCTVYCTACRVLGTVVYCVLCTVYCVLCTVYCVLCDNIKGTAHGAQLTLGLTLGCSNVYCVRRTVKCTAIRGGSSKRERRRGAPLLY